ncbi:cytochrome P450 [Streptomyces gobiensis]|uniref:cytochrome P450 n=1 Tax=Streptomyces gobiensis TaxID=2875706 RepID=UPI0024115EE5|nr:cytochrome P450 [Streptomyces gobiensis]UGY94657.1 cytochrome P450 [Streptomyces gobiensis]
MSAQGPPLSSRPSRPSATAIAPGRLPVLGHVLPLRRRPLDFLASLPAYGDLVEIRLGPRRAYVACHPDVAQQVLRESRTFDRGGPLFDKARTFTGDGLFTCGWEAHRRQRRMMQPAFHAERMAAYATVMCEETEAMLNTWQPGEALDVSEALHVFTTRVAARTLFSTQIDDEAVAEFQRCLPVILRGVYKRMVAPLGLMERLPTPDNRRFEQAQAGLRKVIDQTIAGYPKTGADQGDLMSILIGARDEESGDGLTHREIHDQVMTLLLGGTETAASALSWAFYLLSEHPRIEERLHEELDDVLGGRLPGFGDLPRLPYAQRVITEVLRLFPPGWIFTRLTTQEVDIAGTRLPAGTIVLFSPYVLGRDSASFPVPAEFDPDRWLPERAKAVRRGAMVPFGAGIHKCIGDSFGMTEATLVLTAVASRFRLKPVPGLKIEPLPKVGLVTGPLPMIPEPRRGT